VQLEPGQEVSHYRLTRRLGTGGMGDVFLATDTTLDRQVAIKFLTTPGDEAGRRRLLREARAAAALDHPGICSVYEVGTDAVAGDYIVMQFVAGETLAARLRRGRLLPAEALALVRQMAEALKAAHAQGVVHRDLKPQNIILTPGGAPKLLDFGLAKRVPTSRAAAEAMTASQVTMPYAIVGTPGYMAPEQIRDQPADSRADLFSLGCVTYECLTGRRAFGGQTTPDVLGQVLHVDPAPPSAVVPGLGPRYDGFCARLLRKDAAARFQSADEVIGAAIALGGESGGPPADAPTVPIAPASVPGGRMSGPWRVSQRHTAVFIASLVALVAIVAWAVTRGTRLPPAPPAAADWFRRGVEAIRDGSYATARTQLTEAIRLHDRYPQAYSRLAEAESELDNERAAQRALLRVAELVPNVSRLAVDERLRLDAVRAMVLRQHDQAIAAYLELASRHPDDARGWLDLGRAEEAAWRRSAALEHYRRARDLDSQFAAAHWRVARLDAEAGRTAQALAGFDESIRLYRAGANVEGGAEALVRKGVALSSLSRFDEARKVLEEAVVAAGEYPYQRARAEFELVRVLAAAGDFAGSEALAGRATDEASAANLQTVAANGFVDLSGTFASQGRYEEALGRLDRAAAIASDAGADRILMRAMLQRAAVLERQDQDEAALKLTEASLEFFARGGHVRLELTALNLRARLVESLGRLDEAADSATRVLDLARRIGDDGLAAVALDNLAGQLKQQGRLPEALARREEGLAARRKTGNHALLAFDLANTAEVLQLLGRGPDADRLLDEIESQIAAGHPAYLGRRRRAAVLRALGAAIDGRWSEVVRSTGAAEAAAGQSADDTSRWGQVLAELALAELGRGRTPPATIAAWPAQAPAVQRGEIAYWAARALAARGDRPRAWTVASSAWAEAREANAELRWRLAAVAIQAEPASPPAAGAKMPRAAASIEPIARTWSAEAQRSYLARKDLSALVAVASK
jgi:tetratricopeptide (TPR) repeat protein